MNIENIYKNLEREDFSDEKEVLNRFKEVEKLIKNNQNMFKHEYIILAEVLGQINLLKNNYKDSNKYLLLSRNVYYNPMIDYAFGMNKLFLGDYEGFKFYHNRYKKDDTFNIPNFPMDKVNDFYRLNKNDNLLVLNEQGIGDEILFSRVIPLVAEKVKFLTIKVRTNLLEYFKNKFKNYKNIRFITTALNQEEVNKFNCWSLLGDLFSTLNENDMFKKYNENVKKFEIPNNKKIGISYSHGTLDNVVESKHVIKIKSKRGIPQEWFQKHLIENNYEVIDFTYNEKLENIKGYQNPKNFQETLNNLIKEDINLVITIDSAFAHFTADAGISTIVVINKYKDWRWSFNNKDYNKFFNNIKVMDINEVEKLLINNKGL